MKRLTDEKAPSQATGAQRGPDAVADVAVTELRLRLWLNFVFLVTKS